MVDKILNEFDHTVTRAEISMTPLIDMVFLLLIFFAVTTNFTKETGIDVDKAKASTSRIINRNLFLISISKSGEYWYNQGQRTVDHIMSAVIEEKKKNDELNIVLIPDRDGRVEPLISLMDALRGNGIYKFSIGTQTVSATSLPKP
jgi:biopolymer transport protein ExbD